MKFICASFQNRKKNKPLASELYFPVLKRVQINWIVSDNVYIYIVFILQCHVCKKLLNLHKKSKTLFILVEQLKQFRLYI